MSLKVFANVIPANARLSGRQAGILAYIDNEIPIFPPVRRAGMGMTAIETLAPF